MNEDQTPKPDDPSDEQQLYAELFQKFAALLDSGVEVDDLRRALQGSFMLTNSPEHRQVYDQLRLDIDAYLRARSEGEAAVTIPEGFVPSPDLSKPLDDADS